MSVRRSPRGKWMVHVKIRPPGQEQVEVRKVSPVQTKRGAEQYERQVKEAILAGTWGREVQAVRTFGELAEEYLQTYSAPRDRPSTHRWKKGVVAHQLLPAFGRIRLTEVSAQHLARYAAARVKSVSPTTANKEISILLSILRQGEVWGWLVKVPVWKKLKEPPVEFRFLQHHEASAVLRVAARDWDPWGMAILLGLDTGLRWGEMRGLRWVDLDFQNGLVNVRQTLDNLTDEAQPPKSNKTRAVPMTSRLRDALKHYRHLRGPYVLCTEDGSHLSHTTSQRHLGTICRLAQVEEFSWHDLRHTFASWLVMRGAAIRAVQELLGHASITMTMRYAHLSPGSGRAAIALLESPEEKSVEEQHRRDV